MNKLKDYYEGELDVIEVDDVLAEVSKKGQQEVYVTQYEMLVISEFVRREIKDEKMKDTIFLMGQIDRFMGIKLLKDYEENPPQKEKKNEAE